RVRAAIKNSGIPFPRTKVTVNLAPADIKKEGPQYDLPIALAIVRGSSVDIWRALGSLRSCLEWRVRSLIQ
ncbi:MAG: hypothetical protein HY984_00390, partial [Candidatus Magasanikbacteria bacterium]|nr:hypothetical protein [Candidatus Magasanikbacteria bacterium]